MSVWFAEKEEEGVGGERDAHRDAERRVAELTYLHSVLVVNVKVGPQISA